MERESSQLRHHEQQESATLNQTQHTAIEFASVEEMLRHDASQTPVPSAIAERLHDSIALEPQPTRAWWRRLRLWKR
jgi:hypothetical protein